MARAAAADGASEAAKRAEAARGWVAGETAAQRALRVEAAGRAAALAAVGECELRTPVGHAPKNHGERLVDLRARLGWLVGLGARDVAAQRGAFACAALDRGSGCGAEALSELGALADRCARELGAANGESGESGGGSLRRAAEQPEPVTVRRGDASSRQTLRGRQKECVLAAKELRASADSLESALGDVEAARGAIKAVATQGSGASEPAARALAAADAEAVVKSTKEGAHALARLRLAVAAFNLSELQVSAASDRAAEAGEGEAGEGSGEAVKASIRSAKEKMKKTNSEHQKVLTDNTLVQQTVIEERVYRNEYGGWLSVGVHETFKKLVRVDYRLNDCEKPFLMLCDPCGVIPYVLATEADAMLLLASFQRRATDEQQSS